MTVMLNIIALRDFKGIEIIERYFQTKEQIPFDVKYHDGKPWVYHLFLICRYVNDVNLCYLFRL